MYLYKSPFLKRTIIKSIILISISLVFAVIIGIVLASINNMEKIEDLLETKKPALPSTLYDRNNNVITTFYSDEKRDLITLDMVPDHLEKGLIIYEDESFYHHNGFNVLAILRAAVNNFLGKPVSGASTITQQLARTLFLTHKFSWNRKIKELWIAIQLEKKFTKIEILTLYLNHVPLGYGTSGVQAASKFYFNKNVEELTPAESASVITLISNPTFYSFIKFPKHHRTKQLAVLDRMVKAGVLSEVESQNSFNEFWLKWESTTHTARGAFFNREDKAPFFSDWVLQEITNKLPNVDVFRDGLKIYSTLDVKMNILASNMMEETLKKQQEIFEKHQIKTYNVMQSYYSDSIALMSDTFSLTNVHFNSNRTKIRAIKEANKDIIPALNLTAQTFGLNLVDTSTEIMLEKQTETQQILDEVQGAFIVLDNETGQIITMVGGRKFDPNNRFNYAMQSHRQPGSAFKPLVFSYAFDTRQFNAATVIIDKPHVFKFGSEDPDSWYTPYNYGGRYYGRVSLRNTLKRSLNIPSCIVFYTIGADNNYILPLTRACLLLGIDPEKEMKARFDEPSISTVLGTGSVSPVEMARAYSTFANLGQQITPNAILRIENADGKVIYNPNKDLERYYRENNRKLQIVSPQNAYLMTDILEDVVSKPDGTLSRVMQRMINEGKKFPDVEMAAKTGSTQNWSDAWVICYSPKITVASWVGFDKYGLSLGYNQPGSTVIGETTLEYMRQYHAGMEDVKFEKPEGLLTVRVCSHSGLLPSEACDESDLYYEYFLPGSVPKEHCDYCRKFYVREEKSIDSFYEKYEQKYSKINLNNILDDEDIEVDKSIINKYSTKDEFEIDDDLLLDVDLDVDLDNISIPDDSFLITPTPSPTPEPGNNDPEQGKVDNIDNSNNNENVKIENTIDSQPDNNTEGNVENKEEENN